MGELKARIGPNTAHLCIDMQRLFWDEGPCSISVSTSSSNRQKLKYSQRLADLVTFLRRR